MITPEQPPESDQQRRPPALGPAPDQDRGRQRHARRRRVEPQTCIGGSELHLANGIDHHQRADSPRRPESTQPTADCSRRSQKLGQRHPGQMMLR